MFVFLGWIMLVVALGMFFVFAAMEELSTGVGETLFSLLIALAILFGALWMIYDFNVFDWITGNWLWAGIYTGGYIAIGVGWSFLKWYYYLNSDYVQQQISVHKEMYEKGKVAWEKRGEEIPTLKDYILKNCNQINLFETRNKRKITTWMMTWPLSMPITLFKEYVIELFNKLYKMFTGVYRRILNFVLDRVL